MADWRRRQRSESGQAAAVPQPKRSKEGEDEDADKEVARKKDAEKGKAKFTQAKVLEIQPTMVKAMHKVLFMVRMLEGAVFDTLLLPGDSQAVKNLKARGKHYADEARTKGKNHEMGPPHLQIFDELVAYLKDQQVGELNQKHIRQMEEQMADWSQEEAAVAIKYCRLTACDKQKDCPQWFKLQFAIGGPLEASRIPIIKALQQLGGVHKPGSPPPSGVQRKLEAQLKGIKLGDD